MEQRVGENLGGFNSPHYQRLFYNVSNDGYHHMDIKEDHKPLWNSLTEFGNSVHAPWLVLGDFNSVLSGGDRNGNAHVSSYEVRDFMYCCVDLGLVDLNSISYQYTWTNDTVFCLRLIVLCVLNLSLTVVCKQVSVKRNAKRRFISSLTRDDDSTTSSVDEVHYEFLVYSSNLLGTRKDVDNFYAIVMDFGPKVSPLSGVYLKVVDYAPLIDKVSKTLLAYAGHNLCYAGKLEVICSVIQDIESFWLGILPISMAVLDRLTSLYRRFLWGGNYAPVTWKAMCLSKEQVGLGLRDTRNWNDALLTETL
ncbi:hypothetical protein M9H77_04939 [Catharanthus roseus]|uniref:Uncharacterized protein n=1 Tax=Catharanthus roseus TaxID=4058 RepID=A0ACC0CG18_CATRO|nr:hypothetical protein M9H77_04939 [Catharanthus roseus]